MTLLEIIDNARNILNEPLDSSRTYPDDSSSFWRDTQLQNFVNMAQTELQNVIIQTYEDYFLTDTTFDISDGQSKYTLPNDFIKVRKVEDIRDGTDDPEILVPANLNDGSSDFDDIASDTFGAQKYYIGGNSINFIDTPTFTENSAIRMHYVKRLTDLTAGSLTSELPPEYHYALVWKTVSFALLSQQSDNEVAERQWQSQKKEIIKWAESRQVNTPRFVRQRKDY